MPNFQWKSQGSLFLPRLCCRAGRQKENCQRAISCILYIACFPFRYHHLSEQGCNLSVLLRGKNKQTNKKQQTSKKTQKTTTKKKQQLISYRPGLGKLWPAEYTSYSSSVGKGGRCVMPGCDGHSCRCGFSQGEHPCSYPAPAELILIPWKARAYWWPVWYILTSSSGEGHLGKHHT